MSGNADGERRDLRFGLREIIPLGTMLVAITLAYASLKGDLQVIGRDMGSQDRRVTVLEGRADALDTRIQNSRSDPYRGSDAVRDFYQRDKRLDDHEDRLKRLERDGKH